MTQDFPSTPPEGIALFDLDGTLIAWDCQLLFRHFIVRREAWRGIFLPLFLALAPFAKIIGTEGMKRVFLAYLWQMDPEMLAQYSREFAKSLMPAIYRELRGKLEQHRAQGHLLILSSASPECYVTEIGRELGFDLSLGTPVALGHFFPNLENHKGDAKVTRLRNLLPPSYFNHDRLRGCHGYTDSRADLPMLAICQTATVVNPSAELAVLAEESGWEIVRPARPWKSRAGFAWRAIALLLGLGHDPGGLNHNSI